MLKKRKNLNLIWNIIGIIVGIAILRYGMVFASNTPYSSLDPEHVDSASFNGDFYTYEYEATRAVAQNTYIVAYDMHYLGRLLAQGFGAILIVTGVLTVVCYGKKLCVEIAEGTETQREVREPTMETVTVISSEKSEEK